MHIHHLNCGCMCPLGGALFDGFSRGLSACLVCHCLLVETEQGLVLIDTGFGQRDLEVPYSRLSPFFIQVNNIQFDRKYTALHQLEQLGFSANDVRHIVVTHLDFDHAGGLEDFPEATVHVMQAEIEATQSRRGFIASRRYRPNQWDEVKSWKYYSAGGEPWFGFEAVRNLEGLPPEILMIPLVGHTRGHAGIAIDTPEGWLLHAGDAYFYRHEMGSPQRRCTPGLRAYQWMMEVDRQARIYNQQRLHALSLDRSKDVRLFCSHDAVEFETFAKRSNN
ncbi:MBL fold metallo-hydrolase [Chroococcidiopsis sp. CCALA 051]|uniref:MBL fold metallo-hydrolase n=1 Tax=Chroococcidiopsis sp. CCALA 051 TaxID=869949 RepID=UPI000D0E2BB1|nr:MBL fold metallo-hydrolase [Chroococcidiopsis sp. CCALA 051]MBE9017586.1 MBL fold metallo-hydrolase [Chroococcidiopsidales cyanobacterium LEGE 13417]PSM50894.1 MBL fold metallo-hydrolase [Chroococcidiopsis sp. CCALA 051]